MFQIHVVMRKQWRRKWQNTPVFLPGESPWTEEPGRLQSMGAPRVTHVWSDWARTRARMRKQTNRASLASAFTRPLLKLSPSAPLNLLQLPQMRFAVYVEVTHTTTTTESKKKVKVAQFSVFTLFDHMDYTVHGILQARILEWVAFPFSKGSSQPSDQTQVSCTAGGFFTSWTTRDFFFFWLHCVFIAARWLSLAAVKGNVASWNMKSSWP